MRAVGEGALAGYGTGSMVTSAVGGAHAAARHASHMMGSARGVASAAVANQHMPGDLPGPRSAAFYANRYGYSGAGHLSGTESQVSLLQQQRGVQAGIRQSVETPRVAAYHNENPVSAPSRPRLPLDTEQRIPSGNPAEARRVIMESARQARANPGLLARTPAYPAPSAGGAAPARAKAKAKAAPGRAAPATGGGKGGGKGGPPPWARGAPQRRPGQPKPRMVNPFD